MKGKKDTLQNQINPSKENIIPRNQERNQAKTYLSSRIEAGLKVGLVHPVLQVPDPKGSDLIGGHRLGSGRHRVLRRHLGLGRREGLGHRRWDLGGLLVPHGRRRRRSLSLVILRRRRRHHAPLLWRRLLLLLHRRRHHRRLDHPSRWLHHRRSKKGRWRKTKP